MHAGTVEQPPTRRWVLADLGPQDVTRLRAEVTAQVATWGYEPDDVAVVVTELLANVVRHAWGRGLLSVALRGKQLMVLAGDGSPELPRLLEPDFERDSGRGMWMVSQLAAQWGVRPVMEGKLVWARLPLEVLRHPCQRCGVPAQLHGEGTITGRMFGDGDVSLPVVFCPTCAVQLVAERTGSDSGWGVTGRWPAAIAC